MASKPETTFSNGVNKYVPQAVYRMKNNNPYLGGIPDFWYSGSKADLWCEFKFLPRTPQRGVVKPSQLLSALQLQWLNGRYDEERNVAVIIGCPDGGVILRDQEWLKEFTPTAFRDCLMPRKEIAQWITQATTR